MTSACRDSTGHSAAVVVSPMSKQVERACGRWSWGMREMYSDEELPRMYCSLVGLLYSPLQLRLFGRSHIRRQVPPRPQRRERS